MPTTPSSPQSTMSAITSFPQFARLPPELRRMIWGFACRTGTMRLRLDEVVTTQDNRPTTGMPKFEIIPDYSRQILSHQRRRKAILHANYEARSEALRYLASLDGLSVVVNLKPKARNNRWQARLFVDWIDDIIMLNLQAGSLRDHSQAMRPFAKLTQLAIHPNDHRICNPHIFEQVMGKPGTGLNFYDGLGTVVIHWFPAIKHVSLIMPGYYSEYRRLRSVSKGATPPGYENGELPKSWLLGESIKVDNREKAHALNQHENIMRFVSVSLAEKAHKSLKDQRPDLQINAVLDLTKWNNNTLWC
ncbi:hypothetical protein GGR57DRAFT_484206 [Xylariaceae sp. FL1272]|nr:hypothetical protein GGR57DRAFT_484206 [Xylariaceae sp. FL1272]